MQGRVAALEAERDMHKQQQSAAVARCEQLVAQLNELHRQGTETGAERDRFADRNRFLQGELEKVNELGRSWGFGQGELDGDLAGCLRTMLDRLAAELAAVKFAMRHEIDLATRLTERDAELAELRAWKESAMAVESEWDCQAIAKMLGVPLGASCRKGIAERVLAVLNELAQLRAMCEWHVVQTHTTEAPK